MRQAVPQHRLIDRVHDALLRPVDGAFLAALRVWFGLAMSVSMARFSIHDWIEPLLVSPNFQFKYWGLSWLQPLDGSSMHALFWVLSGLALAMAAGLFFRITAPLFALGLSYVHFLDVTIYLNHYYLACLLAFLLSVSPANRMWSLDAWLRTASARRHSGPHAPQLAPRSDVAAAWLYLFRFQIAIVYFFAGMAKAQPDWLLHAQPLRIWLGANVDLPVLGPLLTWQGVPLFMSWFGFLFDTTIVAWLSFPKTRPWAYGVVVLFHVATRMLFPIGMFPIIMAGSALVFFSPSWPRRLGAWLTRFAPRVRGASSAVAAAPAAIADVQLAPAAPLRAPTASQRLGLYALAMYCSAQLLLPLRHIAYDDNVLWNEQGMRFSWRVMVRAKGGSTTFVVRHLHTGQTWHVQPSAYLTPLQESEMVTQPDLILQLAHHIRDDFHARGLGPVAVRADAYATLNGRRAQRFIDPEVDLAAVSDGLAPATWVLAAPTRPPPHTRPVL